MMLQKGILELRIVGDEPLRVQPAAIEHIPQTITPQDDSLVALGMERHCHDRGAPRIEAGGRLVTITGGAGSCWTRSRLA